MARRMAMLAFALLASLLSAVSGRGGKPIVTLCKESESTFKTTNITMVPDIWYPGEDVVLDINGTLTKAVKKGSKLDAELVFGGFPIRAKEPLCPLAATLGHKCPVKAQEGFQVGPYKLTLPTYITGKVQGSATMTDQDGDLIICIKIKVDLGH